MERESDIMTCTVSMAGPTPSPPMSKWIYAQISTFTSICVFTHMSSSIPSKYVSILLFRRTQTDSLNWSKKMWGFIHTNREHHQADVHQNKPKDLHHRTKGCYWKQVQQSQAFFVGAGWQRWLSALCFKLCVCSHRQEHLVRYLTILNKMNWSHAAYSVKWTIQ